MIPRSVPAWQGELAAAIRDPAELLRLLELPPELLPGARAAAADFPLRVPHAFLRRMRRGDPGDPLLRQVLPLAEETLPAEGFVADPVGDLPATAGTGLIHKYHGRALVVAAGTCAVHCRYCFRRHFPYADNVPDSAQRAALVAQLRRSPEISEVILSGGDPLLLSNPRLAEWLEQLAAIPQLERLRIHSRLPVVLPSRIDDELCRLLGNGRLRGVMVIHANHPQEFDAEVGEVLQGLAAAGVTLLNQAVLLRGVNDRVETLAALSETLFRNGVLPYYLHQLDRVAGAAHFEVAPATALGLLQELRMRLPGYLVPRLVREEQGRPCKTPLEGAGA